jgi:hypothetical protein
MISPEKRPKEAILHNLNFTTAASVLIVLWLPFFAGCTVDNVQHGIYEGLRTRNDLQASPSERAGKPESPDYREYDRLRKEQARSRE